MIKSNSNIIIKADAQKIWHFLEDVSSSLRYNRFHKNIKVQKSYSIHSDQDIIIDHNFGFGNVPMRLHIQESLAPIKLIIEEENINSELMAFNHISKFEIINQGDVCCLNYSVEGTFDNKVADISFTPILKAVIIEELSKIKKTIESSEHNINSFKNKQYNPI